MFLGLLRVIFLQVVGPRQPVGLETVKLLKVSVNAHLGSSWGGGGGVLFSFVFFCFFSVYVLVRGERNNTGDSNPNHVWTSDCHLDFTYTLHFFFVC